MYRQITGIINSFGHEYCYNSGRRNIRQFDDYISNSCDVMGC